MKKIHVKVVVVGIILLGVFAIWNIPESTTVNNLSFGNGVHANIYKDPSCGCCDEYIRVLEKHGVVVSIMTDVDVTEVKSRYMIPSDKQSCHTIEMEGYVVEGHVPMESLEKLLTEKPDINGIGLSGMPLGTPGMPGIKSAPYEVYQIKNSVISVYQVL